MYVRAMTVSLRLRRSRPLPAGFPRRPRGAGEPERNTVLSGLARRQSVGEGPREPPTSRRVILQYGPGHGQPESRRARTVMFEALPERASMEAMPQLAAADAPLARSAAVGNPRRAKPL